MKKTSTLAALALLGASLGMGATPQNVPVNQQQNQRHNDATDKQIAPVRRGPVTPLNPAGIAEDYFDSNGRSPKEYGQWLQNTGRQKWVKAKNK